MGCCGGLSGADRGIMQGDEANVNYFIWTYTWILSSPLWTDVSHITSLENFVWEVFALSTKILCAKRTITFIFQFKIFIFFPIYTGPSLLCSLWKDVRGKTSQGAYLFNHFITIQLSAIETNISQACRKLIPVLHPHSSGVKSCGDTTRLFPVSV